MFLPIGIPSPSSSSYFSLSFYHNYPTTTDTPERAPGEHMRDKPTVVHVYADIIGGIVHERKGR